MGTKRTALLLAAGLAMGAAHAGTYTVMKDIDCKLVSAADLDKVVGKVGKDTGLRLSKDMAVRTEVHCMQDANSKRFLYTIRAAIEKLVGDGEQQRWAVVAQHTPDEASRRQDVTNHRRRAHASRLISLTKP